MVLGHYILIILLLIAGAGITGVFYMVVTGGTDPKDQEAKKKVWLKIGSFWLAFFFITLIFMGAN